MDPTTVEMMFEKLLKKFESSQQAMAERLKSSEESHKATAEALKTLEARFQAASESSCASAEEAEEDIEATEIQLPTQSNNQSGISAQVDQPRHSSTKIDVVKPVVFTGKLGQERSLLWRTFILQLHCYYETLNRNGQSLDDPFRISLAIQNMSGAAAILADNVRVRLANEGNNSLGAFIEELDEFYLHSDEGSAIDQLFKIEQHDMPVTHYYEKFSMILADCVAECAIPKDMAVNCFIRGLIAPLKRRVEAKKTGEELLSNVAENQPELAVLKCYKVALAHERAYNNGKRSIDSAQRGESTSNSSRQTKPTAIASLGQEREQQAPNAGTSSSAAPARRYGARTSRGGPPRCHTCNMLGHIAKYCPADDNIRPSLNMFAPLAEPNSTAVNEPKK